MARRQSSCQAPAREAERALGRVDQALTVAPQFDGCNAFAGPRLPDLAAEELSRHATTKVSDARSAAGR